MATHTIDDSLLNSSEAEAYFKRADRRVMIGLRATVEILGIPAPAYAARGKPGSTPAKAVMDAYQSDNRPSRPTALTPRKPNASPARIAEIQAQRAAHTNDAAVPNLYNETFPPSSAL